MADIIISHKDIKCAIKLEATFDYNIYLTIGLTATKDFYLKIVFIDLTISEYQNLVNLSKKNTSLSIKSNFLDSEGYNISHIVVKKFITNSDLSMLWECLSDSNENLLVLE